MNFKRSAIQHKESAKKEQLSKPQPAAQHVVPVKWWVKLLIVLFAVAVFGGGLTIYVLGNNVYDFLVAAKHDPVAALLDFAGTQPKQDANGRTNILLLGSGGKDYDAGSDLTDSIILVSIDNKTQRVTLTSFPRDLVVKVPEYSEYRRINELFPLARKRLGEEQKDKLIREAIERVSCQPIHYYLKVDFSGFTQIVDALGGIEVTVDKQFTDYQYPAANYGYQTIHFDVGPQHMDGETALKYARSRHGTNGEASDFARAARQHTILEAIWKKVQDMNVLNNPEQIQAIVKTVNDHYETDLKVKEMLKIASLAKKMLKPAQATETPAQLTPTATPTVQNAGTPELTVSTESQNIFNVVLTDGPEGLLYTPTAEVRAKYYGGAFVLLPDGDNYDTICSYISRVLRDPLNSDKGPSIEVLNGTKRSFLSRDVGAVLVKDGFNVQRRDNTFNKKVYDKTIIYDHTRGGNLATIMDLQKLIGGEVVATDPEPVFFSKIGITVVLGNDFTMPEGALGDPTFDSEEHTSSGSSTAFVNPLTEVVAQ